MGISDPLKSDGPRVTLFPLAPAHLVGLGALQAAALVWWLGSAFWALIPLGAFVLFMGLAAFFPDWRLFLPVVRRAPGTADKKICLTFDDGPDPESTPALLDLLERFEAKACFFVVGDKVDACPELIARILQSGHELGNHTRSHDPLIMLRTSATLRRSISACQHSLAAFGVRPLAFRPPAWVVNSRLWRVLLEQGLTCVSARVRGLDRGNRRVHGLADRVLARVGPGDIVALHDCRAKGAATVESWLGEIESILQGLKDRELEAVTLSLLLGRPMMEHIKSRSGEGDAPRAVRTFYDSLASDYDREQESGGQSGLRAAEQRLVSEFIAGLGLADDSPPLVRALELGAGTGRFSLPLAAQVQELVAVDLSAAMLARLEYKAQAEGVENVEVRACDVHDLDDPQPFDLICSFSALEYVPDLDSMLDRLFSLSAPGGRLFITTAHKTLLRLIGQVGNAMRQGFWLHARTLGQMSRALRRAGFREVRVKSAGPAGLLLQVSARRPELAGND